MDLRLLSYFVAVYEGKNLSVAAKRVGVSQPSMSAAVQALEAALGCQLFFRHAKGVTPTVAGERLYPRAMRLTADAEAIRFVLREPKELARLRIGVGSWIPPSKVAVIVRELSLVGTGYDVLLVGDAEDCELRVVSRMALRDDELFSPLWRDDFVLAIPGPHADFRSEDSVQIEELAGCAWLLRDGCEVQAALSAALVKAGVAMAVKATVASDEAARAYLEAGLGGCLVPADSYVSMQARTFQVPGVSLERNIGIAYTRRYPIAPATLAALDRCKRVLGGR